MVLLTGTDLDHGTPTFADNEVGAGAVTIEDVVVENDTQVSVTVFTEDGVTTIGVHTFTYMNDNGSDTVDITVDDS